MPLKNLIRKEIQNLHPCTHGAKLVECAEITGKKEEELLDFSISLNPLVPTGLESILKNAINRINQYPDNRYQRFKKAAARYTDVKPENIIVGNGSSEIIRLFAETILAQGDKVIIPQPTFDEYEYQCRLFGAKPIFVGWEKLLETSLEKTKAIFLCNPNNPTGRLLKKESLISLAKDCASNKTFLFVDEAFIELSDPKESIIALAAKNNFLIAARSLTKSFAVPGLRIGFGVASKALASHLEKARLTWNLNTIGSETGTLLLEKNLDGRFLQKSRDYIKKEREWLLKQLRDIRGFMPMASEANFILVNLTNFSMDSKELTRRMLAQGIIIRDCSSFHNLGKEHIRVAVKTRKDNQKLIKAFALAISEWGQELAKQEIKKAVKRGKTATRIDCEYYPCHFEGQDCTFCFCPFYPCEDNRLGKYIQKQAGGRIWSCQACDLIHKREIAQEVLDLLMKGVEITSIWKTVIEPGLSAMAI